MSSAPKTAADKDLINRAKTQLMLVLGWSENKSYRSLRRAAMDRRVKMSDIAQEVLNCDGSNAERAEAMEMIAAPPRTEIH